VISRSFCSTLRRGGWPCRREYRPPSSVSLFFYLQHPAVGRAQHALLVPVPRWVAGRAGADSPLPAGERSKAEGCVAPCTSTSGKTDFEARSAD